mmetsp:Transcript_37910/g.67965  ORF Transcript_37910/g.67965 Transcript_37910/m.67965 type:complete len:206 (+) Transcript_37910:569-1186(+)
MIPTCQEHVRKNHIHQKVHGHQSNLHGSVLPIDSNKLYDTPHDRICQKVEAPCTLQLSQEHLDLVVPSGLRSLAGTHKPQEQTQSHEHHKVAIFPFMSMEPMSVLSAVDVANDYRKCVNTYDEEHEGDHELRVGWIGVNNCISTCQHDQHEDLQYLSQHHQRLPSYVCELIANTVDLKSRQMIQVGEVAKELAHHDGCQDVQQRV